MYRFIKAALVLAVLLQNLTTFSQNVNGHWFGIGMLQTSGNYNNYLSELTLRQKGKSVSGSLQYYFQDSLVKVAVNGNFTAETHTLTINPFPVMYYQSPSARNSIDCRMSGSFILLASKAESVLAGSLISDADHRYTVPTINFRLKKSDDTAQLVMTNEPEIRRDTVIAAILPPAPEATTVEAFGKREKVFLQEIEIIGSTLKLELYDNGEVDYDSVSLFFNNKLILPKTKLDHKAIKLTISFDPSLEVNELSMFAENLGMIPPNTAALIVHDGTARYEVLLSSDLSKSATLRLRRKK